MIIDILNEDTAMIALYRIYQILIMAPLLLVVTLIVSLIVIIASLLGFGRHVGYWIPCVWGKLFCILAFVRVTVEGRENIEKGTSYVFVANHQGAYDIFSIYGYLGHDFRWMMKKSLMKIPFVGFACKLWGQIFVDTSSPAAVRRTMEAAKKVVSQGMSITVFPEGSRTHDGSIGRFKKGAYLLAEEFKLPVVPISIDGAYAVMPRTSLVPKPGHITLRIHKPITPAECGFDMDKLIEKSRAEILSDLQAH